MDNTLLQLTQISDWGLEAPATKVPAAFKPYIHRSDRVWMIKQFLHSTLVVKWVPKGY